MPVTIGSNVEALRAERQLGRSSASLTKTFQRLSSGLRINRASDDAAGLSIATRLNSDATIYGQAIRNANDGISAISIAEGALKELSNIAIRVMELSEQAANGAYSSVQRRANDLEAQSLSREYTRIVNSTEFNNTQLIRAANSTISLQVGADSSSASRLDVLFNSPVVRGYGDGTLAAPVTLTAHAGSADDFRVADLNNDGNNDLLFYGSAGIVGFFLGNGDGTFQSRITFTTGYTHPGNEPIALTDMNNDGNLDLVTTTLSAVVVTLGNGNGTFKTGVTYAIGADPNGVIAEDFNGDGVKDVAVMAPDITGNLQIFLNNGSGGLGSGTTYATGLGGRQIAAGDLTGDGIIDIYSTLSGQLFIGNGNGTFKLGQTFDTSGINRGLNLTDLNNDGALDLLVGDTGSVIGVRLGNGNGSFKAITTYPTTAMAASFESVAAEDFNSDGYLDVVTAGVGAGKVSVLLNNGDGSFKAATSYVTVANSNIVTVGDLNGDGVADIVTGDYGNSALNIFFTNATTSGGLPQFSLLTASGAKKALDKMRTAVQSIAVGMGQLGAYQSRVDSTLSNLQVIRENLLSSASQITDADIESESAEMVRLRILQQAGAAILAQANQAPALALKLLAG